MPCGSSALLWPNLWLPRAGDRGPAGLPGWRGQDAPARLGSASATAAVVITARSGNLLLPARAGAVRSDCGNGISPLAPVDPCRISPSSGSVGRPLPRLRGARLGPRQGGYEQPSLTTQPVPRCAEQPPAFAFPNTLPSSWAVLPQPPTGAPGSCSGARQPPCPRPSDRQRDAAAGAVSGGGINGHNEAGVSHPFRAELCP